MKLVHNMTNFQLHIFIENYSFLSQLCQKALRLSNSAALRTKPQELILHECSIIRHISEWNRIFNECKTRFGFISLVLIKVWLSKHLHVPQLHRDSLIAMMCLTTIEGGTIVWFVTGSRTWKSPKWNIATKNVWNHFRDVFN